VEPLDGRRCLQSWLLLDTGRSIHESLLSVATVFLVLIFKLLNYWGA
jgi:hypothetical protein